MNKNLFLAIVLAALLAVAPIYAAVQTVPSSSGVAYQSGTGLTVTVNQGHTFTSGGPFVSNGLQFENVTFRATSGSSLDVDALNSSKFTNVSAVSAGGGVNISRPDMQHVILRDDVTSARLTEINVSKTGNTDLIATAATESTITAKTNTGVVAVDLATGNAFDEASPNADGEVSIDVPSGTTSVDFRKGPESLVVRPISEPQTTIKTNSKVNATFFERDSDRVFVRSSTDGRISFSGLPKTEAFVSRVNATGYVNRRILIDSIFEQNSVYLLNESADTVDVSFSINDKTGNFGARSSLVIERAINATDTASDERRYTAVSGAVLGDAREFTTSLERDIRYRLIVRSPSGEERQLGTIVPTRTRAYNLEISGLDLSGGDRGAAGVVETNRTVKNGKDTLVFKYADSENETTKLSGEIYPIGEPDNVLTTFDASPGSLPLGTFRFSEPLTNGAENRSYIVDYEVVRGDSTVTGSKTFKTQQFDISGEFPLESGWGAIFGVGMLLIVAGAFSVANARIGALILPGLALVLWQLGFLSAQVSLLSIAVAFSLAVLYNVVQISRGATA